MAGLIPLRKTNRVYQKQFDSIECGRYLDIFMRNSLENGNKTSYARYEKWARANGAPSGPTLRNRLGSWSAAAAASLARVAMIVEGTVD
jgi:hypothetical protein